MTPDRRTVLTTSAAMAAMAMAPRGAQGRAAKAGDDAKKLYARAMVINGNLVPPIDPDAKMDAALTQEVRSSGLTALKATIGGSNFDYETTVAQMGEYDRAIALNPETYMQARDFADLDAAKQSGRIGIIYSFEGVEMLAGKVDRIAEFRRRGVRVMQLCYNRASPFASGVMAEPPSSGLTPLGREAIARMEALGVTLDLSHADARSTADALKTATRPALITHAGCAAVLDHPRNKADAELRAVAERGGVVGIYELCFLSRGPAQTSVDEYLAHVSHALKVCGEDHVGFGSDALLTAFDTSPESMAAWDADIVARRKAGINAPGEGRPPFVEGMNRADRLEVVTGELLKRGYTARTVEKMLGLNFRRVLEATWTT